MGGGGTTKVILPSRCNSQNFYLFKLDTSEKLAKQQGDGVTNDFPASFDFNRQVISDFCSKSS